MLELKKVSVAFEGKTVLSDCSLFLPRGGRAALMGPSGCGKTTLLRVALGLQEPDAGQGRRGTRRLAAVFQEPRLLPWLSAEENVCLPLPEGERSRENAREWLERLELGQARALLPAELSGGMQQRVSLARALAAEPELLVLDEPFRAFDAPLRERVIELILRSLPDAAVLIATHEREEAERLGCRVYVYRGGRFEPEEDSGS